MRRDPFTPDEQLRVFPRDVRCDGHVLPADGQKDSPPGNAIVYQSW
jgi:hypothetical protein